MAHKYIMTHVRTDYPYSLSAAAAMVSDDGERCPPGQRTVWINCKEGVEEMTALEAVKTVLDDERKSTGSTEGEDGKDHVTVVGYAGTEAVRTYCDEQGWTCPDSSFTIKGYEDEVISIIILIFTHAVLHRLLYYLVLVCMERWLAGQGGDLSLSPGHGE